MSNTGNPWDDERISAYCDGAMDTGERRQFEREMESRPELRAAVDEVRQLRDRLQALPTHQLPPDFAERVLRTAEQRMLLGPGARPTPAANPQAPIRRLPWLLVPLATAAAILLATFLWPRADDRRVAQGKATPAPQRHETFSAPEADSMETMAQATPAAPPDPRATEISRSVNELAEKDQGDVADTFGREADKKIDASLRCMVAEPRSREEWMEMRRLLLSPSDQEESREAQPRGRVAADTANVELRASRPAERDQAERTDAKAALGTASEPVDRADSFAAGEPVRGESNRISYEVFLVSAPTTASLDEYLKQLTATAAVRDLPLDAPDEQRLRAFVERIPSPVRLREMKQGRRGGTAGVQTERAKLGQTEEMVTVTPLAKVHATQDSLQDILQQINSDLSLGVAVLAGRESETTQPTPPLPCSILLIVESETLED